MSKAVFSFDDREAAQRAAERLIEQGLPADAVSVHVHDDTPDSEMATDVDELVSGGLFTNLHRLLEGLFEWGPQAEEREAYVDTLRQGGAVVSVRADSEGEQSAVERVMQTAGVARRTDWSAATIG